MWYWMANDWAECVTFTNKNKIECQGNKANIQQIANANRHPMNRFKLFKLNSIKFSTLPFGWLPDWKWWKSLSNCHMKNRFYFLFFLYFHAYKFCQRVQFVRIWTGYDGPKRAVHHQQQNTSSPPSGCACGHFFSVIRSPSSSPSPLPPLSLTAHALIELTFRIDSDTGPEMKNSTHVVMNRISISPST